MEANKQMIMNKETNVEFSNDVKPSFFKTKKFFWFSIAILVVVSLVSTIPYGFFESHTGHDIWYHSQTINALNDAWKNGNFGSRIYGLICQDYGYGNGLFYSMLPVGTIVIFMNLFHMSASWAVALMFFIIVALSGVIMLIFLKKVFKSNLIAFIEHMLTHKPQPIHESATTASNSLSLQIETILRLCSGSSNIARVIFKKSLGVRSVIVLATSIEFQDKLLPFK